MKKLKLVVSDLHLGTGRIDEDSRINTLEEFYFDEKFVEFLHYYSTGQFETADVELILNGDILNLLQVDYDGFYLTVITEQVSLNKTKRIVEGHPRFFKALKDFLSKPNKSITYVVGNHDQGVLWPAVREYLNDFLGANIRFKNIVYYFDGVHIEHGHMHEAANRLNPKKFFIKKNVPEPILNLPFGSHFFLEFVMRVKQVYPHIDKVRPFYKMIRWTVLNEFRFAMRTFWRLFNYFLKSIFKTDPRFDWPFKRLVQVILESAVFPDLTESARKILNDARVHTVIFGHTHVYNYRQFGNRAEYFNTGTWTDITSLDISTLGKITKLTYVLIEYPDQEGTQPQGFLKEWHGYHRIEQDVMIV
ncbi:MAG: hypothetical protein CL677_04505 [Bdellovibrionaceae bacterium]|nr:hypothetical protein [Pseudobdellovibrionaceae bacterium]|tara:strand:- start:72047 stop:73129 length:1083 start_codon:yes stop_codon:yes gene_type:complete